MEEIAVQIEGYDLVPFSKEDSVKVKKYKQHQILKAKISGVKKPRSYKQLKLFWACCRLTAENSLDPNWNTSEKVAFQCKVALHFVDPSVISVSPDGTVQFLYRSISFKELSHMEACNFITNSIDVMAEHLGCDADQLVDNVD